MPTTRMSSSTPSCAATWDYMVEKGLVSASDNQYDKFVDIELWSALFNQARVETEMSEVDNA